ncbi:MAG: sigma-70 family RNA polymerase sigma factor [Gemmataceae bacterium]
MSSSALAAGLRHLRDRLAAQQINEDSDEQLLRIFLTRRDNSAFEALVRRHGPMVLHVCRRVLGHQQDAEDAYQAVFLVLARNAAALRKKTALASWLHGTAYRLALKAKQAAARRRKHERQAPARPSVNPADELSWREVRALLDEEVGRLPEIYRSVFILCCLESVSVAETARRLGLKQGTVASRLAEARKRLGQRLSRSGVELTALLAAAALASQAASALPIVPLTGITGATVSPAVAALAQSVSPLLGFGKAKAVVAMVLAVGLLGGAGVWFSESRMDKEPAARRGVSPPVLASTGGMTPNRAPERKDAVVYRGRVLGPDDKPVVGAKVYYYFITLQEEAVPVRAVTNAQGRFEFTLTPKDVPLWADASQADPRQSGFLVVKADGSTFAWHRAAKDHTDVTLHVAADDTPLTGRIIDLQGKPLAGLHVSARSVAAPEKGDLTPFVKALRSREPLLDALSKHVPNHLHSPFYWRPRVPLLPDATTDANGRFRLRGFAKEQLVELRIEGPAMETQDVYVMNRLPPRDSSSLLSVPQKKDPFFGPDKSVVVLANDFAYPVPPGLTVAGTVRDENTKRPIPRAIVESYTLAGTMLAQNTIYRTVADERGRYRLGGLPRGKGNRIRIRPPADQPFVPIVKDVPLPIVKDLPAVKSFAEAAVDAALRRGVWVDVTVADKAAGRPVPGSVSYFVLPEKPSPEEPFERPFADEYNNFMTIRNDGTFRFVAVPRRAIVAFQTAWNKLFDYPIAREAATVQLPGGLGASNFQAFAEINPKLGDAPVKVKFVLDAGRVVKGKLVDSEGRPLVGVLATSLRDDWHWEPLQALETDEFTVLGMEPNRPRLVCFVHEEKKLAGSVVVRGDEKAPLTVKLQPWATVSGRLLDADGKPIANATLWFTEVPVRKPGQPMSLDTGLHVVEHSAYKPNPDPRTDEQGRFRVERLVPGLQYNLALVNESGATTFEQIKWEGLVFAKLILKAGESKDLGDVKLQPFPSRDRKDYRTKPVGHAGSVPMLGTLPASGGLTPRRAPEAANTLEIQGRVLDPDGKPVRRAKLFVPRPTKDGPSHNQDVVGSTDAQGRFRVSVRRTDRDVPTYLLAHAAGFGVDWVDVSEGERPAEVTLRLVKDVPITGRIVNTEGRPVSGISLSIREIDVPPNEKLDDYLAGWLRDWRDNLSTPRKRLIVPLNQVLGAATTDKDGRFTLHGVGGERIVYFNLSGGGMAQESLHIITRPGFDATPYNAVLRKEEIKRFLALNPFRGLEPPSLTFVAQPGKTIEGTVKDAASGKPLPGFGVSVYIGWSDFVRTVSDAGGKYHLDGVPKNTQGYDVSVGPPKDAAYLFRREQVEDTAGFAKVQLDLALVQGVFVTGRVVDKQTGKGVWGSVGYAPLPDNKFIGSKPGFNSDRRGAATDKTDGRFRFVTIPGRALLTVQVHQGENFHGQHLCVYRKTGPDPDHKDLFQYDPDGDFWYVTTANGLDLLSVTDAVKVIDVKENGENRVDLFVDRGVIARIAVQDADGKPLAGAWAAGVTDHWPIAYKLPEATATVYALNPDKPRTMAFFHADKKLGGTATVRGDEKEPVVVKLAPVGKVSGRLLDGDGNPLEGVEVSINPPGVIGSELYRFAAPSGKPAHTDKDGRFRIEGVVPDLKFWLNLRKERTFFIGVPRIGVRQVKAGEALDLGDIRTKPQR